MEEVRACQARLALPKQCGCGVTVDVVKAAQSALLEHRFSILHLVHMACGVSASAVRAFNGARITAVNCRRMMNDE